MSIAPGQLPAAARTFGLVRGRIVLAVADTAADADDKPDARAPAGTVTFTPRRESFRTVDDGPLLHALVLVAPSTVQLDDQGSLIDDQGRPGIWLIEGRYTVTAALTAAGRPLTFPLFEIEVTREHTAAQPLDLFDEAPIVIGPGVTVARWSLPPGGAAGTVLGKSSAENGDVEWITPAAGVTVAGISDVPGLAAALAGKADDADVAAVVAAYEGMAVDVDGKVDATDPRLADARTPTVHGHTMAQVDGLASALADAATPTSWAAVTGKPAVIGAGATSAAARAVIGAVSDSDPRLSDARTPTAHGHPIAEVTGLTAALAEKVDDTDARLADARTPTSHDHPMGEVTGLTAALADLAAADDVTALAGDLDALSDALAEATTRPWLMGYALGSASPVLPVAEMPWVSLTHVVLGTTTPQADGSLQATYGLDATAGPVWAGQAIAAAHEHGVSALLMVGGAWSATAWAEATSTPAKRGVLVAAILAEVDARGFDGVDLDLEPLTDVEGTALVAVAQALRAARPALLITAAVPAINTNVAQYNPGQLPATTVAALAPILDRVNTMTYEMAGHDGWLPWHSSPLFGETGSTPVSVSSTVDWYLAHGVPAGKLGVGFGMFGQGFTGAAGPKQAAGTLTLTGGDGLYPYSEIVALATTARRRWDAAARVPYLIDTAPFGTPPATYLSYEDPRSAREKAAYARARGLGGMVAWQLAEGYLPGEPAGLRHPLAAAAYAGLASAAADPTPVTVDDVVGLRDQLAGKVNDADPRLSDPREPTSHGHLVEQISDATTVGQAVVAAADAAAARSAIAAGTSNLELGSTSATAKRGDYTALTYITQVWCRTDAPVPSGQYGDVQVIASANATVTGQPIPAGAVGVDVTCISCGGPGGGGRRGAAGSVRCGGGGGAGGGVAAAYLPVEEAKGAATYSLTVGASGAVGAGATFDDANGGTGVASGFATAFYWGSQTLSAGRALQAYQGQPGGGGSATAGTGGSVTTNVTGSGTAGGSANTSGAAGGASSNAVGAPGGGAGGGITAANAASAGGAAGSPLWYSGGTAVAGGAIDMAGVLGLSLHPYGLRPGSGGSGGGASLTGPGGGGGSGGWPGGGGGGGGASANGFAGGAGGYGGTGVLVLRWHIRAA